MLYQMLQIVKSIYSINQQMKLKNKREKLVLNRHKMDACPAQSSSQVNGLLKPTQNALNIKDINNIRLQNFVVKKSIFRSKSIPSLNKDFSSKQPCITKQIAASRIFKQNQQQRRIFFICQETVKSFKYNFQNTNQGKENNVVDKLGQLFLQIAQKIMHEKYINSFQTYRQKSFHTNDTKQLKIVKVLQINQKYKKSSRLSFNVAFDPFVINKNTNQIKKDVVNQPSNQSISPLTKKLKISSEINIKIITNNQPKEIKKEENMRITQAEQRIKHLRKNIDDSEKYLIQIERKVKQINIFIDRSPNKKLRQQVQEYKQIQQQLFDFAFLFDQPSLGQWVHNVSNFIAVPYEDFKRTLKSFGHQQQNNNYILSKDEFNRFKANISNTYQYTIDKFKQFIQNKYSKIQTFVQIMKKLASSTISKRQYLTEINKKMAITSINIQKIINKFSSSYALLSTTTPQMNEFLNNLKNHFKSLSNIYCQAEIYY